MIFLKKKHIEVSVRKKLIFITFVETIEASQTILDDDSCGFPIENLIYTVIQCFMTTNEGLILKVFLTLLSER